jgi:hypothetical protein
MGERMNAVTMMIVLALTLVGCASAGNQVLKGQTSDTADQYIHDGQSTKADIRAVYGDPTDTSFTDNGNEIWKYIYAYVTPNISTLT